jgi:hypothetical protein
MQTVRIRRSATLWFPPRKLEFGPTHAGWPFICFEITDGWVRARMFRTTIRLASSRRVEVNPDPQFDPDIRRVLGRRMHLISFESARRLFRTTTKVALRFVIKRLRLTRPRGLLALSSRDQGDPDLASGRTRERGDVNVLAFDAGEHHAREGERWSRRWPARIETLHQILLEVHDDEGFRETIDALRRAGFIVADRNPCRIQAAGSEP